MKKQVRLAVAGIAVGMASLVTVTPSATAQLVPFPRLAHGLTTWMVRAMEQCTSPTVSVLTPGSPSEGCLQANGTQTDNTVGPMKWAKIYVHNRGRIAVFGKGFTFGDELQIRLKLRVTRTGVNTLHPLGSAKTVTFADFTVDCPKAPDAFNARPNGAVIGSATLAACLDPNTGLVNGNVEILDVSLVNAVTHKVVAVPGLLR